MPSILKTGLLLIGMAVISLCLGGIAGITSAKASAGFARICVETYLVRYKPIPLRT